MEGAPFDKDRQDISKTDWNVPPNVPRNYMQYFIDMVMPVYTKAVEELSYGTFMIDNVWFQQYVKHGMNDSHIHDLGKFIFAFSIVWTYMWFSQFMLIWYANNPEAVTYQMERIELDN